MYFYVSNQKESYGGQDILFLKNRSAAGVCETVRFKLLADNFKGEKQKNKVK